MSGNKPEIIARKRHSAFMRYRMARRVRGATAQTPRYAETFEHFQQGVAGTLPSQGEGGVIVVSCDDFYYRSFAVTLILSMENVAAAQRVHVHLCSPSPQALHHIAHLAGSLRYVTLTWTVDQCLLADRLRYRTIYFAAARFLIASTLMEAAQSPLLCLDVDGLAAVPVWPAYERVRASADILVIRRPEEPRLSRKILASAVGMNFTPQGRRFAAALGRSLAAILPLGPKYHIDQITIHTLIGEMTEKAGLQVAEMPQAFADHDFAPGSVIWTTKGWSRKESPAYLEAKQQIARLHPDLHAVAPYAGPVLEVRA